MQNLDHSANLKLQQQSMYRCNMGFFDKIDI